MFDIRTFSGQTPDNIRFGDTVTDNLGRMYIAESNAEKDAHGQYNVMSGGKWFAYDVTDLVTISYDASVWESEDMYA